MKKTIVAMILVPTFAFANVTVHQDEFALDGASEGSHFWARLYDWTAWEKTDKQKSLDLDTNFVKEAYLAGDDEYDADGLDEDEVFSMLGPVEGPALYEFYEEREERYEEEPLDPEEISGPSGLTTVIKVAVDLPADFDVKNVGLERTYRLIAKADQPHIHTEVSKDFVHNFVDSLHSAHKAVDNIGEGRIVLSTINTGSDYYQCSALNTALKFKGGLDGITTYDGDFRTYVINTVTEMDMRQDFNGKKLIEGAPSKVFKQKIIYSSNLIKSGVNFLAFYELANGKKKMVLNSVIVSTGQVREVPGNFVNGLGITSDLFSGIKFKDGVAVLNSGNVDLSPVSGNCSKGLGQGMGRYVLGLADSIVKWSLLIK